MMRGKEGREKGKRRKKAEIERKPKYKKNYRKREIKEGREGRKREEGI